MCRSECRHKKGSPVSMACTFSSLNLQLGSSEIGFRSIQSCHKDMFGFLGFRVWAFLEVTCSWRSKSTE